MYVPTKHTFGVILILDKEINKTAVSTLSTECVAAEAAVVMAVVKPLIHCSVILSKKLEIAELNKQND
jgi:hypothetical protein